MLFVALRKDTAAGVLTVGAGWMTDIWICPTPLVRLVVADPSQVISSITMFISAPVIVITQQIACLPDEQRHDYSEIVQGVTQGSMKWLIWRAIWWTQHLFHFNNNSPLNKRKKKKSWGQSALEQHYHDWFWLCWHMRQECRAQRYWLKAWNWKLFIWWHWGKDTVTEPFGNMTTKQAGLLGTHSVFQSQRGIAICVPMSRNNIPCLYCSQISCASHLSSVFYFHCTITSPSFRQKNHLQGI